MLIKISQLTGKEYDATEVIAIFNPVQYSKYVFNGAEIVDCGTDNSGKFFLLFNRSKVQHLFDAWCKHEL